MNHLDHISDETLFSQDLSAEPATPIDPEEMYADEFAASEAHFKPATYQLLARIAETQYASQLKPFRREIAGARLGDEADVVFNALQARRAQLVAPQNAEPEDIPEPTPVTEPEKPWSPTASIDENAPPRELDWRERQLPNGDRD